MTRAGQLRLLLAGAPVCAGSFWLDGAVIRWVGAHPDRAVQHVARWFTRWGDFPPVFALLIVLMLCGWAARRRYPARVTAAMAAAACAGGLTANVLRFVTGRARPGARVPAGWYGFWDHGRWIAGGYAYSSFPSAHTAVVMACIVPLWRFVPGRLRLGIGLPATAAALCVAASRILLNAHHLSDVLVSTWLGVLIGMEICIRLRGWVEAGRAGTGEPPESH